MGIINIDRISFSLILCLQFLIHSLIHSSLSHSPIFQNRDRLELYALHKQAVSGDAPMNLPTQTASERAKYNAWRSKAGLATGEAMRLYITECDRQVRVYGIMMMASSNNTAGGSGNADSNAALLDHDSAASHAVAGANTSQQQPSIQQQPRGLAAIPLLCAAASESRTAYLRRLANTRLEQAWWSRQEALCATPGSLWALPETLLIHVAILVEYTSLTFDVFGVLPRAVVQSFLWPLHNVLLACWMSLILVSTTWTGVVDVTQTILWGSRRTGLNLVSLWKDCLVLGSKSAYSLTESHQPLTARLVGLTLLPLTWMIQATAKLPVIWGSVAFVAIMVVTWWYWWLVLPWLGLCLLGVSIVAGNCFALIEMAGV